MKMIVFNQNPMIAKLLESVSKKLELPMENFNHYEELSARLKKDPEWLLIADDESLEKLDQVDWLELKEIISQNHLNLCMYKKGNEAQPFLEGFEMKMKKPFLPTEVLKILQKKLGFNASEPESSQNLEPVKETLEANWDALEDLGDLEALAKEEPNAEEQLLPTLDAQKENEEVKEEEKQEVAETPQEKEKSQDDGTQENAETQEVAETPQEIEASQELENPQVQKLETQEVTEQTETQEVAEEKQEQEQVKEKSQDSPSAQELEAMQELVKEIQENSNEDKKETQKIAETPQNEEVSKELEMPQELEASQVQELEARELENQEIAEASQAQETETQEVTEQKETQEIAETPQETEIKTQNQETPQETQDNYETIEDIPEPVMAKAMGEALPLVNDALIETSNNENAAQTPKESVTETPQENAKDSKKSDATSSPLELRLNLQDLLKSLNQESLKSLLENKTLSIKITLEDKNPHA